MIDGGQPLGSAAITHLETANFEVGLPQGKIRTILKKDVGNGFRSSGIFFLSDTPDPTLTGSRCYFLEILDGATNIRLNKANNGLLDQSNVTLLQAYVDTPSVPIPNSASEVVCEVEWLAGIFTPFLGGVQIKVRFWNNSTDFNDMVELSPTVIDSTLPIVYGQREGLFARSRSSTEPMDAKFDNTRVTKLDVTP